MKRILAAVVGIPLVLTGCAALTTASNTVCGDIAKLPAAATAVLDAQDPHSALGVLWADAKAGCVNGAPAAAVDTSWTGMVWGELKALAPTLIP